MKLASVKLEYVKLENVKCVINQNYWSKIGHVGEKLICTTVTCGAINVLFVGFAAIVLEFTQRVAGEVGD